MSEASGQWTGGRSPLRRLSPAAPIAPGRPRTPCRSCGARPCPRHRTPRCTAGCRWGAMPTGKFSGSFFKKPRTALGWSTARPSTCQPCAALAVLKALSKGNSSTHGGHQVAQKFTSKGRPRMATRFTASPLGPSKWPAQNAASAPLNTGCGAMRRQDIQAPAAAAATAAPVIKRVLRCSFIRPAQGYRPYRPCADAAQRHHRAACGLAHQA